MAGAPLTPAGAEEQRALEAAAAEGGDAPVQVGDGTVVPGASGFAAGAARNDLPATPRRGPDPARLRRRWRPARRSYAGVSSLVAQPEARPAPTAARGGRGAAAVGRAGGRGRRRRDDRRHRVRRRRRPAARAHDLRRDRADAARRAAVRRRDPHPAGPPRQAARRARGRGPRAARRLHGALDRLVARAVGLLDRVGPDVRLPRRRSPARWRSPGSRPAAGRPCCTGSRWPASPSAAGRC